jgi:predicted ribosome quality control (RQC) complex YloA/Tae2 family protein
MKVVLDLRKSVTDNAKAHYERSKKLRGKIAGMGKAIADTKRKLESLADEPAPKETITKKAERKWYEKFRWFVSSQGFMVLGGRDASTNETLVKRHMDPGDAVFHADVQGAPFFIVKNPDAAAIPQETRAEAAQAAASYSKAWARGLGSADVYEVKPEQVSKTPPAGEYLGKGAFMVYGEKTWHRHIGLKAAVGILDGQIIGGPPSAVAARAKDHIIVSPGDTPQGALAKQVRSKLGGGDLDDIQRHLPPGGGVTG